MIVGDSPLSYYSSHGPLTDPRDEIGCFEGLPDDVARLRDLVQGLLIHVFWLGRYGVTVPESRHEELQLRAVPDKLKQIRALYAGPLSAKRPPEKRLLGNCRDFSIMLCSMLRHHRIPARARCGFATYFAPNRFEDHWVCEYWGGERWTMVDAQLDAFQRSRLGIDFNPLDVPSDRFLVGGKAWQMCRTGGADPDTFGIMDLHGLWFVRGNLVRDLASLNKVELLPWDCWGLADKEEKSMTGSDRALLDKAATLSQAGNDRFADVRSLYVGSDLLRVPPVIRSYLATGSVEVDIGRRFRLE